MSETIAIKPIDLERQKITEPIFLFIEFHDHYLIYRAKFYADEPKGDDEALGWQNQFNDYETYARKEFIAGVEREWVKKTKVWMITIYVNGMSYDIKLYFKRESECANVFNKITSYLWPNPQ